VARENIELKMSPGRNRRYRIDELTKPITATSTQEKHPPLKPSISNTCNYFFLKTLASPKLHTRESYKN
jgi:hypothetical protein